MSDTTPKKTVLHDLHVSLGARMGPFGGWQMPIQYEGILKEHETARTGAVLFDTCHMGEFRVSGPTALPYLEHLVSCDVGDLEPGQCRYGLLCNEQGGTIDDLVVYRMEPESFMIVVNAGTQDNDAAWFRRHLAPQSVFKNLSDQTAKIDLQGPASPPVLQALVARPIADLRYYRFASNRYRGKDVLVSRTGYTGEIGFEVYFDPPELAIAFWKDAMERGAVPAGLGARDTLRLEMGMPLYGHELNEDRNAGDSGFVRALSTRKDFIGAAAVRRGGAARLCALCLEGRSAARAGDTVKSQSGKTAGVVTSGSFSPSLGRAIAMAYVTKELAGPGTKLNIQTSRQVLPCSVGTVPFYTRGTARRPLAEFLGPVAP